MKVTFDIDPDLYRAIKGRATRTKRSLAEVVAEAISGWLEAAEEAEDRASAAGALDEYRREGGTPAEAFFQY